MTENSQKLLEILSHEHTATWVPACAVHLWLDTTVDTQTLIKPVSAVMTVANQLGLPMHASTMNHPTLAHTSVGVPTADGLDLDQVLQIATDEHAPDIDQVWLGIGAQRRSLLNRLHVVVSDFDFQMPEQAGEPGRVIYLAATGTEPRVLTELAQKLAGLGAEDIQTRVLAL